MEDPQTDPSAQPTAGDDKDTLIDPVLLSEGDTLAAMITGSGGEDDTTQDDMFDPLMLDSKVSDSSQRSIFEVNGTPFVQLLASINVVRIEKAPNLVADYGGNSRDIPKFIPSTVFD